MTQENRPPFNSCMSGVNDFLCSLPLSPPPTRYMKHYMKSGVFGPAKRLAQCSLRIAQIAEMLGLEIHMIDEGANRR
jgi:hypothetical protein